MAAFRADSRRRIPCQKPGWVFQSGRHLPSLTVRWRALTLTGVDKCLVAKHMKTETSEEPVVKLPYAKPALQDLGELKVHTLSTGGASGVDGSSSGG